MDRRQLMTAATFFTVFAASLRPQRSEAADGAGERDTSLDAILQDYLTRYGLPALAAAVVAKGEIVASGAVGTRRAGTDTPVTLSDRFHIGSDAKAMTALLAAMLVEEGKLRWDSTVGEVFPELRPTMDTGLREVTLEQLLSHTSGIPSDNDAIRKLIVQSFAQEDRNLDELRYWLLTQWSAQPLESKPGERFAYSNLGYTFAGAMIERAGGETWEELVAERVFDPLGLKSAGFGPQSSLGRVDAPLGHAMQPDGTLKPMLAGPNGDVPAIIGPAGDVHLWVLDFARWAGWNAAEGRRGPALIQPETMRKLHTKVIEMPPKPDAPPGTPSVGGYGLGWGTATLPYSPEPFLVHGGSNTLNFAVILVQPKIDFALVLMTNVGGPNADNALKTLGQELYRRYAPAR